MVMVSCFIEESGKKFAAHVSKYYWKPVFWKKAYCAISAGGAPLETLKRYTEPRE